jgi:hypothetical protein
MKSSKQNSLKAQAISMTRVKRIDLMPTFNMLSLSLVAASTAFFMLMLGL